MIEDVRDIIVKETQHLKEVLPELEEMVSNDDRR